MAVIKNLLVRIGADYSEARKGLQGASKELGRFKRDTERTTSTIKGKNGVAGINKEFKSMGDAIYGSLSRLRGARGIGGVVSELRTLTPALSASAKGFRGLGGAASGSAIALRSAGGGAAIFAVAVAAATLGIYHASQAAVKYEADINRLNLALKGGARGYMDWARSAGIAKSTAAELGATYGILLSSFISDTQELQSQTAQLTHATRVIASATGRSLEDTFQRVRSGMLGSTEAIEDLGVYVNISMIESTKAFKRFAGDKSWAQLDFQTQQQIRLAAILEQTYARYGNTLQKNVMTKQERMMDSLRDTKLHLSQAFLPIWDTVLPALTEMSKALAYTTEQVARFFYWLRGWDYDERTRGIDDQTGAIDDLGDSMKETEKDAKKAYKALAAFDQLNLIGESGSGSGIGGGGSGTGGGGSGGMPPVGGGSGSGPGGIDIPDGPPFNNRRWRIEFDPPNPPDAGAGAVATAVTNTVNGLIAETKRSFTGLWDDLRVKAGVGAIGQQTAWGNMWNDMRARTVEGRTAVQSQTSGLYSETVKTSGEATGKVKIDWKSTLASMLSDLFVYRPRILTEWGLIKSTVDSTKVPLNSTKTEWNGTLNDMQAKLNGYRPYLEWGWHLIGTAVRNTKSPLAELKLDWNSTLSDMYSTAASKLGGIVDKINGVVGAWLEMKRALNASPAAPVPTSSPAPATSLPGVTSPSPVTAPSTTGRPTWVDNSPVLGDLYRGLDWIRDNTSWTKNLAPYMVPGAGLSGAGGSLSGAAAQASKYVDDAIKALSNMFKGAGISVPAFAGGAVVYGPTLAMVGDNRGASVDPEVIAPLSKLEDIMGSRNDKELINELRAIRQAVKDLKYLQAVISANEVTRAAVDGINDQNRRMGKMPLNL